ncbi:FCPB [Symbiodinium natans]|uniref:FCPB protein n=1 Tax=Symbiodinium natans TaxID=878477 RepID=A0A812JWI3_9DINO|nr:FCPB [Symbiodinium natans]
MYGRSRRPALYPRESRWDRSGADPTNRIQSADDLSGVGSATRARPLPRFLAASDAAEDVPGQGTGGFHIVWLDKPEKRESLAAVVNSELYALFAPGEHKIAQLELAMVFYGLVVRAESFRGRRGYWYIDNVAALMALVRGLKLAGP